MKYGRGKRIRGEHGADANAAETGAKSILSGFSSALTIMEALSSETAGMGLGFEKGMGQAVNAATSMQKGLQSLNITKSIDEITKSTGSLSNETATLAMRAGKDMFQAVSSMEPLVKGWQTASKAVEGYEKTQSLTQIASKGGLDVMQTGVAQGETI